MAAYPSIAIAITNFKELPRGYPTIRNGFEAGYVQTRAKTTTAPRRFRFMHETILASDVTTWTTFWEARKGGAEAFDFTDPRTAAVISCRFVHDAGSPPDIVPRGANNVAFNIGPIEIEEAL